MPKYARPAHPESVEAAIEAFGNRVRVAILGTLQKDGPGTRGEIAKRIGAVDKTVQVHLRVLEELDLVASDPPPEARKSGQRVRYRPLNANIDMLLQALTEAVRGA
ncbi:ArsR/SmtB family transcription factor [Brevibacterium sp. FME37]|uniref:ArsR/SmtB family transcription factor n=1 Tax=Brevibacterium sp. FME37 TaxID=2742607 RepID=UPI001867F863|nr:winged helix-turn-helix domain-containing protein [Brevibacterium sp. FME37]